MPNSISSKKNKLEPSQLEIMLSTEMGFLNSLKNKKIKFNPKTVQTEQISPLKKPIVKKETFVDFYLGISEKIDEILRKHESENLSKKPVIEEVVEAREVWNKKPETPNLTTEKKNAFSNFQEEKFESEPLFEPHPDLKFNGTIEPPKHFIFENTEIKKEDEEFNNTLIGGDGKSSQQWLMGLGRIKVRNKETKTRKTNNNGVAFVKKEIEQTKQELERKKKELEEMERIAKEKEEELKRKKEERKKKEKLRQIELKKKAKEEKLKEKERLKEEQEKQKELLKLEKQKKLEQKTKEKERIKKERERQKELLKLEKQKKLEQKTREKKRIKKERERQKELLKLEQQKKIEEKQKEKEKLKAQMEREKKLKEQEKQTNIEEQIKEKELIKAESEKQKLLEKQEKLKKLEAECQIKEQKQKEKIVEKEEEKKLTDLIKTKEQPVQKEEDITVLDEEVSQALTIIDNLLEQLPEETIDEFVQSEDFTVYEKVVSKYKKK